eukprot:scaffold28030_cov72-Phaeocystis_antarctica.AAC.12
MPEDRSPPPDGSVESPESLRRNDLAVVGDRRPPGCRGFRPPWRACGGVGRPRGGAEGRGQPGAALSQGRAMAANRLAASPLQTR